MSSFYDQVEKHCYTREERRHLDTAQLRFFNNQCKSHLLHKFVLPGDSILDLGAGKGGDLWKYKEVKAQVVFLLDASKPSLDEARKRYDEMRAECDFNAQFMHRDFCAEDCFDDFRDDIFDVVSCQFALHYAFDPRDDFLSARRLLRNVARVLKRGGYFVCTFPVDYKIREFRDNNICTIKRRENDYLFTLKGAVGDVPEYYISTTNLFGIASLYNLRVVYYEECNELNNVQMTRDENDVANLYAMCALKKQ